MEGNLKLDGLTGDMVSFESPVKSVVVEKPTGKVAPSIIVVGVASTILTCVVSVILIGWKPQQIVEAFGIGFNRHSV